MVRFGQTPPAETCPGGAAPVSARDGELARVRVPGGELAPAQLTALARLADRYGDGELDLTARANVQLRGLRAADGDAVASVLAAAGFLPSRAHELVRNLTASPFAGADPDEAADLRPFVRAYDKRLLEDAALAALPPKFCLAFDGGGYALDVAGADLAARARGDGASFDLVVGGLRADVAVPACELVATLLGLARGALALATAAGATPGRWRLGRLSEVREALLVSLDAPGRTPAAVAPALAPLGVLAARDPARVNLVPQVPLGRLSSLGARGLAACAERAGAELRLAPWRGIVLANVPRAALGETAATLERLGLALDDRQGFAGLAACAGTGACASALADVRRDAARLAAIRASLGASGSRDGGAAIRTAQFSGCEKRCAMRRDADIDLVAASEGYELRLAGRLVGRGLDAATAIALATGASA